MHNPINKKRQTISRTRTIQKSASCQVYREIINNSSSFDTSSSSSSSESSDTPLKR